MKHIVYFLEADRPLTKRFTQSANGEIEKDAYPLAYEVSSHKYEIDTISDLYKAIAIHAKKGHCLIKGELSRSLTMESRRGTTRTDASTNWICLDFDKHEVEDIETELKRLDLDDISYIVQYSSSHNLPGNEDTVSCHVFMLLDGMIPAPDLKLWLKDINISYMQSGLRLTRDRNQISWPLDVSTCQNDKLLYIAPPIFEKPLTDPVKDRIQLVPKKLAKMPVKRIEVKTPSEINAAERRELNILRKELGMEPRRAKTIMVGDKEIHTKPDACTVTGIKDCGEFIRLNLNGGDSWAYYHTRDNFEFIHDFKSDAYYRTKELIPGYYRDKVTEQAELNNTPSENGDQPLAFRDKTTAQYYNGIWNEEQQYLELHPAKNETQLEHWMMSQGRAMGDFIPIWDITYRPLEDWIVDNESHSINMFRMTEYLRLDPKDNNKFPVIKSLLMHMLGVKTDEDPIYTHFINWLAVVIQRKGAPHVQTSWVLHGNEGTGKGTFFHKIMRPILGDSNSTIINVDNVEEQFNSWLENKLFIYVDEVDIADFKEKGRVSGKLRTYITDPTISVRRMRQAPVSIPNYAAFVFASNQKRPVQIPPSDRRYNVANFQKERLDYPGDEAIANELTDFTQYILAYKADADLANTVIDTEERRNIQALSVTSVDATCNYILNGDFDALWFSRMNEDVLELPGMGDRNRMAQSYNTLLDNLAKSLLIEPVRKLTRDEIYVILQYNIGNIPESPNKLTALLRHHGIVTKKIWMNGSSQMGLDLKWTMSDELRKELHSKFNSTPKLRRMK